MTEYNYGDTVRLKATFYGWDDIAVNVSNITLKIYDASKSLIATINTADITNPETGVYYYDYTLTQEGLLVYEFSGTFLTKTILRRESIDVVFV